jgi:stress-induced morphogen
MHLARERDSRSRSGDELVARDPGPKYAHLRMSSPREKIRQAIEQSFAGSQVSFELLKNERLIVTVVADSFTNHPVAERTSRIRSCLAERLTTEQNALILNVVAETPEEHSSLGETLPSREGTD